MTRPRAAPGDPTALPDEGNGRGEAACTGCPVADRRAFLAEAARLAAGLALSLALSPRRAKALPILLGGPSRSAGSQLTYPIPGADGATIDRDNDVILVRYRGDLYAFNRSCPHQNTALRWLDDEGRFQCPKHKSTYQPDGTFISGRATRGMDRFAIRKSETGVVVDLDRLFRQDEQLAEWSAAVVQL